MTEVGSGQSAGTGIWSQDAQGHWSVRRPVGFKREAELHDLIEQTPAMLPLAGSPTLAVLGREVSLGRESADLLAVEVDRGRPVLLEIKLASNTDRRQVFTQVLGYAAALRRLDAQRLERLLAPHLLRRGADRISDLAGGAAADPTFEAGTFDSNLETCLREGQLRCVVVLDHAPQELVELAGYLQEVTNDRLTLDVVVVSAYAVGAETIMVPQLVEPESPTAGELPETRVAAQAVVRGAADFEAYVSALPEARRAHIQRLLAWARQLEAAGVADLWSWVGPLRAILHVRLPGQARSLATIWTEGKGHLSPYRTVFQEVAPNTWQIIASKFPEEIRQGNYVSDDHLDELLILTAQAYEEAAGRSPDRSLE